MDTNGSIRAEEVLARLRRSALAPGELEAALEELCRREEALARRERELEESSRRAQELYLYYREMFEFAPDSYLVTDPAGTIREANQASAALLGTRKEFLVGKPLPLFVERQGRRDFYTQLARLGMTGMGARDWEARLQPTRGEPMHVALAVTPIPDGGSGVLGFRWLLRDVSARKQAEQSLRDEKVFVENLLDTAQALVLVLDVNETITRANPYAWVVLGYSPEELKGRHWSFLLPEAERPLAHSLIAQAAQTGARTTGIHALESRDGSRRIIAWSGKILDPNLVGTAILLVGHDITELQEAQEKRIQRERLAVVGEMVAGLAHESRNALQRSQACLERLSWKLADRPAVLDLVARAQKAQDDLSHLLEDVRQFAAPFRLACRPVDVAEVWREA